MDKTCQNCFWSAELTRPNVLIWCSHKGIAGWYTAPVCELTLWREDNRPPSNTENTENP